jgi:hypothetical protein
LIKFEVEFGNIVNGGVSVLGKQVHDLPPSPKHGKIAKVADGAEQEEDRAPADNPDLRESKWLEISKL